jgi:CheY-like chemotaxis protein
MTSRHRVALLGFTPLERFALAECLRAAVRRETLFEPVDAMAGADFLLADADHAPAVHEVSAAGRMDDTVFVGRRAPAGATAWMLRPVDPEQLLRELDALVALQRMAADAGAAPRPATPAAAPAAPVPAVSLAARLPLRPVRPLPVAAPQPPGAPRALLVDDSEVALAFLSRRLERWGVHCTTATDSLRALAMLAQQRFDMVFIDVELGPGSPLDGLALCQRLRRRHPAHGESSPLLALVSSHHGEVDRARGTLAGADAYLGKPLDEDALDAVLRRRGLTPVAGRLGH